MTATACAGASFSGADTTAGGSHSTTAGTANDSGATSRGGQAASGESGSADAGAATPGAAGDAALAGAAGTGGTLDCAALGGSPFLGHCYVDATIKSVAYAEAVATCAELASRTGRTGQLLVLDSQEEQAFILSQFLSAFTDASDAWLSLTCDAIRYPEFTSCYCINCDASQRMEKRAAWAWLDESTAAFGWIGQNPDGEGRCSALAYNSGNATWGWVDRSCTKTTHQLTGYPVHEYRTICELE